MQSPKLLHHEKNCLRLMTSICNQLAGWSKLIRNKTYKFWCCTNYSPRWLLALVTNSSIRWRFLYLFKIWFNHGTVLVRRVNGVWKVQKVDKSRHLLLIQSKPPNNDIEIFVKKITEILYQTKFVTLSESKCCQNYGQCSAKVEMDSWQWLDSICEALFTKRARSDIYIPLKISHWIWNYLW